MKTATRIEDLPLLLTASQAARLLGIHRTTVYTLVDEGKLRAVRPLRELRFPRDAVEQFVRDMPSAKGAAR